MKYLKRFGIILALFILCVFSSAGTKAFADCAPQISDLDCAALNGPWPNWDPITSVNSSCTPDSSNVAGSIEDGSKNIKPAFDYFVSAGLTAVQAAALVGNMDAESGLYPGRIQGQPPSVIGVTPTPGVGFGIVQWTTADRQAGLVALAQSQKKANNDLGVQLDYAWQELNSSYKDFLTQLKATTDVQKASDLVLYYYESAADREPGGANSVLRGTLSAQILKQYGGDAGSGGGGSTNTTDGSCDGTTTTGGGSCKNPVRDVKGIIQERIDQGVDYGGSGPVHPMCPGQVVMVRTDAGWPGGYFIVVHVSGSNSPADGKYIYFTEDCSPLVKVGDTVTTDTNLCSMFDGGDGVETGWGVPPDQGDIALAHSEYAHDGLATSYGQNFSAFLKSVGAPPGLLSHSSGVSNTPLPAGWPTWN